MTNLTVSLNSNTSNVEKFVRFLMNELQINPDILEIASYDDKDNSGLCYDVSDTEFVVFVKEANRNIGEIFTTIAHEMVHVKQYMKENLGSLMDNSSSIPYLDRWWEKEAYYRSVPLVEKYIKGITL